MIDRERKRRIAQAATPGPWTEHVDDPAYGIEIHGADDYVTSAGVCSNDAAHIAENDPSSVLEMLDEIERLERENAAQVQEIATLRAELILEQAEQAEQADEIDFQRGGFEAQTQVNRELLAAIEDYKRESSIIANENRRLREVLEHIATFDSYSAANIARKALEELK